MGRRGSKSRAYCQAATHRSSSRPMTPVGAIGHLPPPAFVAAASGPLLDSSAVGGACRRFARMTSCESAAL